MSESTTPKPTITPHPVPKPVSTPAVVPAPVVGSEATEAATWGRVDEEGNVWLRTAEGEVVVGQYAAEGSKEDALAIYVRRYLDLKAQLALIEARVETVSPEESTAALKAFDKTLAEPNAVGDIDALRARSSELGAKLVELRAQAQAKREKARAEALAKRESIVDRAEAIAASINSPINWRDTRAELMSLLDEWKDAQKKGPRIDKTTSDALWKRLSKARKIFEDARRVYFANLDKQRAQVTAAKEALIARAVELSTSTDWRTTSNEMHDLMDQWKAAGRASKKDDDKLWARFMEAREVFFAARTAHHNAVDSEYAANLEAKLELVKEAEALLPITDIAAARNALHEIGERWETIGMVPRDDYPKIEARLRKVEDAIANAEAEQWRRTDPEKKQRSNGMAAQLEALIAEIDVDLEKARAAGNDKKVKELSEAREARQAWLDQVNAEL